MYTILYLRTFPQPIFKGYFAPYIGPCTIFSIRIQCNTKKKIMNKSQSIFWGFKPPDTCVATNKSFEMSDHIILNIQQCRNLETTQ